MRQEEREKREGKQPGMSSRSPQQQQLALKIRILKLRRINELNAKLRTELARERITASNACLNLVNHTTSVPDYAVPELWGYPPPGSNRFLEAVRGGRGAQHRQEGADACCTIS